MQLPESSDSHNSILSIHTSVRSAYVTSDFIPTMPLSVTEMTKMLNLGFHFSPTLFLEGALTCVTWALCRGHALQHALWAARQKRNVSSVKVCWRFYGGYYVRVTAYWKFCVMFLALRCAISVCVLLYALLCTKYSFYSKYRDLEQSFPYALKTTEVGYILHIVSIITVAPPLTKAS